MAIFPFSETIERIKFSLLLTALGIKLELQSLSSKEFRKELSDSQFTLVIRSEKDSVAHTYYVKNGFVLAIPGACRKPDTELVWDNAETGLRAMLSKNELDIYSAIGSGKLKIKGNFANALTFMSIAK